MAGDSCGGVDCGETWWGDRWGTYCIYYNTYVRFDSIQLFNGVEGGDEDEYEDEDGFRVRLKPEAERPFSRPKFIGSFSLGAVSLRCSHNYVVCGTKISINKRKVAVGNILGNPTIITISEAVE